MSDIYPYAEAAWAYRKAGWAGVIPIGRGPAQKSPPPSGYTGYAGVDPSGPDIQTWLEGREAAYNIGLHMAPGQYVLDVDAHSGKPAAESLAALVASAGALPSTWSSTARGPDADSRQYFFRAVLPEGRVWIDHPGPLPGLDSLHAGHRYAVVWPSINPDAGGATYEWYDPTGELYEGVPWPADLAELPAAWIEALSKPGEPMAGAAASDELTLSTIRRFRAGEPCRVVQTSLAAEFARIAGATSGGALHDPGKLYPLVAYGFEGHRGAQLALSQHQAAYVEARVRLRDESEDSASADWWRQVRGAVGKKMHADPGAEIPTTCTCDDPFDGIIPTDDQPGESPESPAESDDLPAAAESYLDFLEASLVDTDTLDDIPEHEPLVPGVLNRDSLAWIYGAPASFKSFLALDLAGSVALGQSWQGFDTAETGTVLYLVAEGRSGIRKRVRAWEEHNGRRMKSVRFLPIAVQASSTEQWKAFMQLAAKIGPALVIVDTQARVTAGMEENSAKEMGEFVRRLDQLRIATGACVLTIHHTGRNGEHMRGSIAMDGAADTTIKIVREDSHCVVSCTKQKDTEEFEPFLTRMVEVGNSIVFRRDDAVASAAGSRLPAWIKTMWDHHGTDAVSPTLLDETKVVPKATFYGHVKALVAAGVLIKLDAGRYPKYRLAGLPGSEQSPESPTVRHVGLSDSGDSESHQTLLDSAGLSDSACSICGEDLDEIHRNQGHTTHPSC